MVFKNNKEFLEQTKGQNPELYEAMISVLKSMIEMGKQLGFDSQQDVQEQEGQQGLNEDFPSAQQESQQVGSEEGEDPTKKLLGRPQQ